MQARALITMLSTISIAVAAPGLAQARGAGAGAGAGAGVANRPERGAHGRVAVAADRPEHGPHGGVAVAAGASGGTPFVVSAPTGGTDGKARATNHLTRRHGGHSGRNAHRHSHALTQRGGAQLVSGVHAPITAETEGFAGSYEGPIFQRASTGTVVPFVSAASSAETTVSTGGSPVGVAADVKPQLLVPGSTAEVVEGGLAAAPMEAPESIQEMIWAANEIVGLPYIYGGGHGSFKSPGYDCSGTVSYALHGASLIETPMDSSEMMRWGQHGVGRWVTIFANPEHAYMTIAGLRLDTSTANDPGGLPGPRWRALRPGNPGFVKRHPAGL